jgi:hypothetical protein
VNAARAADGLPDAELAEVDPVRQNDTGVILSGRLRAVRLRDDENPDERGEQVRTW